MEEYVSKQNLQQYATDSTTKYKTIFATKNEVGSPLVAATAAAMTDTTKIYVYVGSEAGYTNGHWYYYNGSAWADGGNYNSTGFQTDDTLSIAGMAADAKAVGDMNVLHVNGNASYQSNYTGAQIDTAVGNALSPDTTLAVAGKTADAKVTGDKINETSSHLIQNVSDIENIAIEGYEHSSGEIIADLISDNTMINSNGTTSTVAGWKCGEFSVNEGQIVEITGTGNPAFVVENAGGDVIATYNPGVYAEITNYKYLVPTGADKIYINRISANPVLTTAIKNYNMNSSFADSFNSLNKLKDITIEGFSGTYEEASGTYYSNTMLLMNGTQTTVAGWTAFETDVNEGEIYFVTGTGNPAVFILNENNVSIWNYNPGAYVNITDYKVVAPKGSKKLCVNRSGSAPVVIKYNMYEFINNTNVSVVGTKENQYKFGKVFNNVIGLYSSANNLFNFVGEIQYNNNSFKNCGDDIAPVALNYAGYVGANHGYYFGYECTSVSHGLVEADIGKTYDDGTDSWVLIKIISSDKFQMVCYDSTKWFKAKTNTVPESVNYGSTLTITSSNLVQIYPSVKNGTVKVLENTENKTVILEQYDVIDLGDGIDKLIENVGDNDNSSLVELSECVLHFNTIYELNQFGAATIYQQLQKLKGYAVVNEFYGTQCLAFGSGDLFAVLGTTFPTLQNSQLAVPKENWSDSNKAPSVFIKTSSDKSKGFVIAYLMDRTADIYSSAGWVNATTQKLYPEMAQPAYDDTIRKYENIILRLPIVKNSDTSKADYLSYTKVGSDVYVFVGNLTAKTVEVTLEEYENIYGRKVSIVEANNITLNTDVIVSSINITSSGEGYALLKIYN